MSTTNIVSVEFATEIQSAFSRGNREKTIDARKVHKELGIKNRYDKWIDDVRESLGIEPDVITGASPLKSSETKNAGGVKVTMPRGRPLTSHLLLSPRDVKEILIASRTAKGKAVRKWYLDLEEHVMSQREQRESDPDLAEIAQALLPPRAFTEDQLDTLRTMAGYIVKSVSAEVERRNKPVLGLLYEIKRAQYGLPAPRPRIAQGQTSMGF